MYAVAARAVVRSAQHVEAQRDDAGGSNLDGRRGERPEGELLERPSTQQRTSVAPVAYISVAALFYVPAAYVPRDFGFEALAADAVVRMHSAVRARTQPRTTWAAAVAMEEDG